MRRITDSFGDGLLEPFNGSMLALIEDRWFSSLFDAQFFEKYRPASACE
jgi:hypothetical protein